VTGITSNILAVLIAGSLVYCILAIVAARNYLRVPPLRRANRQPISILKPLYGSDDGLEENLHSFFLQDYPNFEILMSVRAETDPEAFTAKRVMRQFPKVPARLVVTGDSPRPNGKVYSLQQMLLHAQHQILVMADSDIRVTPDMLRILAAEMHDPAITLATCPYRAMPGDSWWSRMEAVGMNTEFLSGVLVARLLDGMNFALGCTLAIRREALDGIGGLAALQDYLAEDFMMGKLVAQNGGHVILSSYVIQHWIGSQGFRANLRHRLRWARSTRRSRPLGYFGQLFTNPLPLALLFLAVDPKSWPLAALAISLRAATAWIMASFVLASPLTVRQWFLVPLQDAASFFVWILGFFGNRIEWRGRRHAVLPNGMFETPPGNLLQTEGGDEIQIGRVTAPPSGSGRRRRAGKAGTTAPRR
jgi:ceramide glucosyltransferase